MASPVTVTDILDAIAAAAQTVDDETAMTTEEIAGALGIELSRARVLIKKGLVEGKLRRTKRAAIGWLDGRRYHQPAFAVVTNERTG